MQEEQTVIFIFPFNLKPLIRKWDVIYESILICIIKIYDYEENFNNDIEVYNNIPNILSTQIENNNIKINDGKLELIKIDTTFDKLLSWRTNIILSENKFMNFLEMIKSEIIN